MEEEIVRLLKEKKITVATGESLTGGLLAGTIVNVNGASTVFQGGLVTYTNEMKHRLLGVKRRTLREFGAVSRETVCEMARGVSKRTGADFSIATTGLAGPEPDEGKPVGLVYIGCYDRKKRILRVKELHLTGNRQQIREKTIKEAFCLLKKAIA